MKVSRYQKRAVRQRVFRPQVLLGAIVLASILSLVVFGLNGISSRVEERQTEYLEQCVQRSAIQCYVIEGRFPTTEEGVDYLSEHYGLHIDQRRYVVYYESFADNLLPQVRVIVISPDSPTDRINQSLGFESGQLPPGDSEAIKQEP